MYLAPGEDFIAEGDIGRELGFVAKGILDVIYQDKLQGDSVLRSIYADTGDIPTIVGEIAFFLNMHQPYKVGTLSPRLGGRRAAAREGMCEGGGEVVGHAGAIGGAAM